MPAIGAILPALSQGANYARLMSALGVSAETVDTVSQGLETVTEVADTVTGVQEQVGQFSEGLNTLLEGNDLSQYPNVQAAMEKGDPVLEQAYASLSPSTPLDERMALQEANHTPTQMPEAYNVAPVAGDAGEEPGPLYN